MRIVWNLGYDLKPLGELKQIIQNYLAQHTDPVSARSVPPADSTLIPSPPHYGAPIPIEQASTRFDHRRRKPPGSNEDVRMLLDLRTTEPIRRMWLLVVAVQLLRRVPRCKLQWATCLGFPASMNHCSLSSIRCNLKTLPPPWVTRLSLQWLWTLLVHLRTGGMASPPIRRSRR